MKTKIRFIAALAAIAIVAVSCGKYEEGPAISLLPKTMRLINQWSLEESYLGGVEQTLTDDQKKDIFEIKKDNVFEITDYTGTVSVTSTGTWELSSSKEILTLTYGTGALQFSIEYTILRLTSKEMWLTTSDLGAEQEYHYVQN